MALDFGANKEFDLARNRAKQQEAANLKGQKDALARRAAQLGGGPSGAFIKQEQIAGDESAKRLGQAHEGIDSMQAQEQRRLNELEQGQKFVTGERMGSQDFASAQAAAARDFAAKERAAAEKFATGERISSQDFGAGQAKLARDLQSAQFDKTFQQSLAAFEHEKYIDGQNLELAKRMEAQNAKGGFLDNLFGGGGGGSDGGMFSGMNGSGAGKLFAKAPTWARVAADPMGAGIGAAKKKFRIKI